jgi:hypothetical protein
MPVLANADAASTTVVGRWTSGSLLVKNVILLVAFSALRFKCSLQVVDGAQLASILPGGSMVTVSQFGCYPILQKPAHAVCGMP